MKTLNIFLTDAEYKRVTKVKDKLKMNYHDFLLHLVALREQWDEDKIGVIIEK